LKQLEQQASAKYREPCKTNALFGWWWADPVAALTMLPIIIKEGFDVLCGKACHCD
jgi:hypothetical protein